MHNAHFPVTSPEDLKAALAALDGGVARPVAGVIWVAPEIEGQRYRFSAQWEGMDSPVVVYAPFYLNPPLREGLTRAARRHLWGMAWFVLLSVTALTWVVALGWT